MNLVSYLRVSTEKQGRSGLGIQAQKAIIDSYAEKTDSVIVSEFIDIQSGSTLERKGLLKAIASAKAFNAKLVVAKVDRLSREGFTVLSMLQTEGVQWIEAESPNDSELIRELKFILAKDEREKISTRTKQALQALKAQGVKLGKAENFTAKGREQGGKSMADKARTAKANKQAFYVIAQERDRGFSYRSIALKLNEMGFKTRRGKSFTGVQVKNIESYFA